MFITPIHPLLLIPTHKSFTSTISFSEQGTPTSKHYVNLRYHGNSLPRHVHFPYRYVLRGPTMASSNISCYAFFVHNPRNVLCVNSKPSHKERTLCARSRLHCNVFFSTHVKIKKYTKGDWRESYIITWLCCCLVKPFCACLDHLSERRTKLERSQLKSKNINKEIDKEIGKNCCWSGFDKEIFWTCAEPKNHNVTLK